MHLNDDVLIRTLDAITFFGPIELFNKIVVEYLPTSDYGMHCLYANTIFSVSGRYKADCDTRDMTIIYGHPKKGSVSNFCNLSEPCFLT